MKEFTAVENWLNIFHQSRRMPYGIEMALVMEICTEEGNQFMLCEILRQLKCLLAVVASKGIKVNLQQNAHVSYLLKNFWLGSQVVIPFGVSQHGLVALDKKIKEHCFPIEWKGNKGKFYKDVIIL